MVIIFSLGLLAAATLLLTIISLRARRRSIAQQGVPQFRISFDSASLTLVDLRQNSAGEAEMAWSEVSRVVAFKRDLFAYDCICLFCARSDDTGIEFDEEMLGWVPFCEALPKFLPSCSPFHKWVFPVATPAFATNLTELYSRPATTSA